jgi:hypothetical protein
MSGRKLTRGLVLAGDVLMFRLSLGPSIPPSLFLGQGTDLYTKQIREKKKDTEDGQPRTHLFSNDQDC